MISNLGKAITILAKAEAAEIAYHDDVDAWGAPSECHNLVSKGEAKRARLARRHAEAVAQRPLRIIEKEAAQRGCPLNYNNRSYGRLMCSLIPHHGG